MNSNNLLNSDLINIMGNTHLVKRNLADMDLWETLDSLEFWNSNNNLVSFKVYTDVVPVTGATDFISSDDLNAKVKSIMEQKGHNCKSLQVVEMYKDLTNISYLDEYYKRKTYDNYGHIVLNCKKYKKIDFLPNVQGKIPNVQH